MIVEQEEIHVSEVFSYKVSDFCEGELSVRDQHIKRFRILKSCNIVYNTIIIVLGSLCRCVQIS